MDPHQLDADPDPGDPYQLNLVPDLDPVDQLNADPALDKDPFREITDPDPSPNPTQKRENPTFFNKKIYFSKKCSVLLFIG